MSSLSERWFGRYSDDYLDLTTTRAFLVGLGINVLYLVVFVLMLALSLNGTSATVERENVTAVGFLLVILGGIDRWWLSLSLPYLGARQRTGTKI